MSVFDHGAASLLPLAVAIPMLGAGLILVVRRRLPRAALDLLAIAVSAGVTGLSGYFLAIASSGRLVNWAAQWTPIHRHSVGIVLEVDPVGAGIALIASALVTCALIFSIRYLESDTGHFHLLVLCFLAGMEGFALTGDLFDLFVFLELMSAAAYALTALEIEDPKALQGGLNFGLINSLGAYISLLGVGLLYAKTSSLQLPLLGAALHGQHMSALVIAAFVLVMTGFFVKASLVPFHFWLADAHAVAPAPVCLLFSGVMVPLGIYAIFRVYWTVFSPVITPAHARLAFLAIGVATALVGSVMCVSQRHIKRLLAYSTIAHVGLFVCALGLLREDGTSAAAIYVAGHAGVKGALFLLCGMLLDRYGNVDELQLFGKGRDAPHLGFLFALGGLALAGLPPFGLGLGKALAESAPSMPACRGWSRCSCSSPRSVVGRSFALRRACFSVSAIVPRQMRNTAPLGRSAPRRDASMRGRWRRSARLASCSPARSPSACSPASGMRARARPAISSTAPDTSRTPLAMSRTSSTSRRRRPTGISSASSSGCSRRCSRSALPQRRATADACSCMCPRFAWRRVPRCGRCTASTRVTSATTSLGSWPGAPSSPA